MNGGGDESGGEGAERNPAEAEARELLELCAVEKRWSIERLEDRLAALGEGTWVADADELEHGVRVAWRNHAKCIGRLFWTSMEVRDMRDVDDPDEVHAALLEHLDAATNGGKVRPRVTIFAPADAEGPRVRIWNRQLLGYAGYRQADGTVIGDPANAEFTDQVRALGWSGAGGRFDLLPLVIQRRGEAPRLYPAPVAHALEVPLRHPEFEWFAELGLKWYAVPVIADMLLRVGGVDYPAAPFNGWYMGMEVGRELADESRYNQLPEIAERTYGGQNSWSPSWKDWALEELNAAVLYSCTEAGVRLVEQHRESVEFIEFVAREGKLGRAESADWSWKVPPVSGSAMPLISQRWQTLDVRPDYFSQEVAWESFSG
jgi:nitric-oxide synthase